MSKDFKLEGTKIGSGRSGTYFEPRRYSSTLSRNEAHYDKVICSFAKLTRLEAKSNEWTTLEAEVSAATGSDESRQHPIWINAESSLRPKISNRIDR